MKSYMGAQAGDMQHKQAAWLILGIFVVLGIIGVLSAVAIPHAGQMVYQDKAEARETEFLRIQTAVTALLRQSPAGALEPIGPTADLSGVRSADDYPLYLSDYLPRGEGNWLTPECRYSFTADGTVVQYTD